MDQQEFPKQQSVPQPPAPPSPGMLRRLEERVGGLGKWLIKTAPILLFAFIVVGGISGYLYFEWRKKAGFDDAWVEYMVLYDHMAEPEDEVDEWSCRPKLLLIDMTSGVSGSRVDPLFFKLDKEIRARSPDEVGCLAFISWGRTMVGEYTDGEKGYAVACSLVLVDAESGEILATEEFEGDDPSETKDHDGESTGRKPKQKVISYLEHRMKVSISLSARHEKWLLLQEQEIAAEKERAAKQAEREAMEKEDAALHLQFVIDHLIPGLSYLRFAEVAQAAKELTPELKTDKWRDYVEWKVGHDFDDFDKLHQQCAAILEEHTYTGIIVAKATGSSKVDKHVSARDGQLLLAHTDDPDEEPVEIVWNRLHPDSYLTLVEFCREQMPPKEKSESAEPIRELRKLFEKFSKHIK